MQGAQVDLALILAVDVSSSIDAGDFHLQMFGIAAALRDKDVHEAIHTGKYGAIALSLVQWSSTASQAVSLDWSYIGQATQAETLANAIEKTTRSWVPGGTAMGVAIEACTAHFQTLPWPAGRHVIDVSGDGAENEGGDVIAARDDAVTAKITINGLPIISGSAMIEDYYAKIVIGGPNCFYIPATNIEAFRDAMTRKLLREIETIAA